MICRRPYSPPGSTSVYVCRTGCIPCRVNAKRLWMHRAQLELTQHSAACFATLTYSDEFVPPGANLSKRDVQLFHKRLRKEFPPFRYIFVGEYGDHSFRPHYHAIYYGFGIEWSEVFQCVWAKGHTLLGEVNERTIRYVLGYTRKKMTRPDDPLLKGREPEFTLYSTNPGIGGAAMADVARSMINKATGEILGISEDVPTSLMHGKKQLPLGRYLRKKLREELGYDNTGATEEGLQKFTAEMQDLYRSYLDDPAYSSGSFKAYLVAKCKGSADLIEAYAKIFTQEKSI